MNTETQKLLEILNRRIASWEMSTSQRLVLAELHKLRDLYQL
jgi:hypothetical protein